MNALLFQVKRAVITGGGEPTLLAHEKLVDLVRDLNKFPTVVLITNSYIYGQMADPQKYLLDLKQAGLTVLAISRHGYDPSSNFEIMKLNINAEKVATAALKVGLKVRWICVLQKTGVFDSSSLEKYLDWVISTGVHEICFKELYVSTEHESIYTTSAHNSYSEQNQVSLNLITEYATQNNWTKVGTLPWGAPIYNCLYKDHPLKIAAYTEPSVYWELTNGLCRSWNIMSDGTCYASLETKKSLII